MTAQGARRDQGDLSPGGKKLDPRAVRLFDGDNLIFLATIMPDGSPQLSPVWAELEENHILINTAKGRLKHKNILRDPRVAVSVVSRDDPLAMTTIRGKVEKITEDPNYTHIDRLTQKYTGQDRYPFRQPNELRLILKIIPERVYVMPELHATS